MSPRNLVRRAAVFGLLVAMRTSPVLGEQMRVAVLTPSEMQTGEALGIAVTSRGRLLLAPRVAPFGKSMSAEFPSQVFAAAADAGGNVLLATGPDGAVVKVTRAGEPSVLFRASEPLVTAVLPLPNGEILAASAPGGKIYKVRPDGHGAVWCETDERYVWALAASKDGSFLAATGDRGRAMNTSRCQGSRRTLGGANPALTKASRQASRGNSPNWWRSWNTSTRPSATRSRIAKSRSCVVVPLLGAWAQAI